MKISTRFLGARDIYHIGLIGLEDKLQQFDQYLGYQSRLNFKDFAAWLMSRSIRVTVYVLKGASFFETVRRHYAVREFVKAMKRCGLYISYGEFWDVYCYIDSKHRESLSLALGCEPGRLITRFDKNPDLFSELERSLGANITEQGKI